MREIRSDPGRTPEMTERGYFCRNSPFSGIRVRRGTPVKQILWWLIAGSRGGVNRARIILALRNRPYNANQLTQMCHLDYKTVRHHLDVLKKHQVITTTGEEYGSMYFLSEQMKSGYDDFLGIWRQIEAPAEMKEG